MPLSAKAELPALFSRAFLAVVPPPEQRRACRLAATAFTVILAAGCGGAPSKSKSAAPLPSASSQLAGVAAAATASSARPRFPSGPLPPLGLGPAPNVAESGIASSKRAKETPRPSAETCIATFKVASGDVAREVARLASACAGDANAKMGPVGPVLKGAQAAEKAANAFPFAAERGRCYRVLAVAAAGVKSMSLVVQDSKGAVATERVGLGPAYGAPSLGALCFSDADNATIIASVGEGEGAFALQVIADTK